MKTYFLGFFAAALVLCSLSAFSQKTKLLSVRIDYTDFNADRLVAIDCNGFKRLPKTEIAKTSVQKQPKLKSFEKSTKYFMTADRSDKIDVKGIITFFYKNASVKYCFDRYGLFYGNGRYFINKLLIESIKDKIGSEK